jgi:UDPglucose 6-dehydrogenase
MADERLISDKYLRGGMGDGGACHPRDNIALSWLAREIDLSYDWYENLMISREKHTEWLANLCIEYSEKTGLEIMILGRSFKKESNLTTGSPSYLLKNILKEKQIEVSIHDPYIDKETLDLKTPKLFFIGTDHDVFKNYVFPEGSTVIDPWRIIDRNEQFNLISVGNSY